MATSPNYGWLEPDNTDLVKNGALAIRTLGNAIDTTMATMTPKSIVDAKGDLIAASAADTPARLAVGANNTKLVAASGEATGLKWVGFQGASVWKSASQNASNATQTTMSFDTEVFDTDSFHDNSTNNSRLTIPTGMGGKYLVTCKADFAPSANGQRVMYHLVDGTLVNFVISPVNTSVNGSAIALSAVYNLNAGQYVEMAVYQDSGATLAITGTAYYYTNMQITYLGA